MAARIRPERAIGFALPLKLLVGKRDTAFAELALLAEAGLALGGLVAVKMLLTRAPVEDLFGLGRKMGER